MARVKKGVTAHARHKKILKLAKGYRGTRSRLFKKANETVMKALYYARRDRRAKKREFRQLWIARINAAARINGTTGSRFSLIKFVRNRTIRFRRSIPITQSHEYGTR